jgi:hypothetical protein
MPYIRLTMTAPPPDRLAAVQQYYETLLTYVSTLPGFLTGWVVLRTEAGEVGRLTVWQSETAANHAATDAHTLALHAQAQYTAGGNLWDCSFSATGPTPPLPPPAPALDPAAAVRAVEAWYARPQQRHPREGQA